jgi:hypothetical protein
VALRVRASVGTEITIRSQILAQRKSPRKERPAREARNVHATSSSQWGQTTPIVGPAHALGTRREERGASNTAIKEDLRLDSSFAEFFLEILRSVRVAMGES